MHNLLFFVWMLLYPIFDTINTKLYLKILKKAHITMPSPAHFYIQNIIQYIIYIIVAYFLYQK